jgi:DNA-binding transcriptional regulator LsrR (DeoR family)
LIVGIGQISGEGFLVSSGMIRPDEVVELKRVGACADLLGHFFSADGRMLETDLSARATSMSAAELRKHRIVAIAGGQAKVAALRAVLQSRVLHGFITDEATAQALATDKPETTSGKEKSKSRKGK